MSAAQNIPELLQRLHRLHRQINELHSRRTRADRKVTIAQKKLTDAQANLEAVKAEQTELFLAAKEKESLFAQSETALSKRRTQLSEAKNNKEYQSLKDQIDADQLVNNRLADEALELIGKAEDFSAVLDKATKLVEEAKQSIINAEHEVAEEGPMIAADVERFSAKLSEAETELPRDFRGPYERMIKAFGGENGMAPVVDQSFCGNCRQQIPIRYIAQICENKPFICQACGRLLFLPEGYVLK